MRYGKTEENVAMLVDEYAELYGRNPTFRELAKKSSLSGPALRYRLSMLVHSGIVQKHKERRGGRTTYVYCNGSETDYWV